MAAEDWGILPWEIAQDDDKLTWFLRWNEYRKMKTRARAHGREVG